MRITIVFICSVLFCSVSDVYTMQQQAPVQVASWREKLSSMCEQVGSAAAYSMTATVFVALNGIVEKELILAHFIAPYILLKIAKILHNKPLQYRDYFFKQLVSFLLTGGAYALGYDSGKSAALLQNEQGVCRLSEALELCTKQCDYLYS